MQIQEVKIENFRAHARTVVPISNFGCLIGENNAGKSSVLHAIHFALKGAPPSKLDEGDFRDSSLPINIELTLSGITQTDLDKITDDNHRSSVAKIIEGGSLTLVRSAAINTKTTLQYLSKQPIDSKWSLDTLVAAMKGNTGSDLRDAAISVLPDLKVIETPLTSQVKIREAREKLLLDLAPDDFELRPTALPTGIEAALRPIFPEVIYIEAVKDTAAEVKTSDSATFGKLLRILLDAVAGEITNLTTAFSDVQKKLSRIQLADGTIEDLRLDQVREIESTIEKHVQESFPGVTLQMEVPAPDLKMILNSAELNIDDGHEGPIGRKGDGLKRAVAFAILRAYMAFQKDGLATSDDVPPFSPAYLLLFEEPELYLHPRAQRQLFEALSVFAGSHQVLVTTHSPSFFSADATSTFVKLYKTKGSNEDKASSKALPIDLRDAVSLRDAFQIICHENNEAALFSRVVVLVEGDSDTIVFPHLAKTLDSSWDHIADNISYVQIGGKSNIRRYRDFFALFEIPVHAIVDLDAIDEGFEHISQNGDARAKRDLLMDAVARRVEALDKANEPGGKIRSASKSATQRARWDSAKSGFAAWKEDPSGSHFEEIRHILEDFFAWTQGSVRLEVLTSSDPEIAAALDALLQILRDEGSHILKRGDLEAYYSSPPVKRAGDKVRYAVDFCQEINSSDDLKARHGANGASVEQELREIFASIYS